MMYSKKLIPVFSFLIFGATLFGQKESKAITKAVTNDVTSGTASGFVENKGQICDQNFLPRKDVLFAGSGEGVNYFLRNNGISYQFMKIDRWVNKENRKTKAQFRIPEQASVYRLDLKWIGTNPGAKIESQDALEGYNNYYLPQCPQGIHGVRTFKTLTFRNIYQGIDLVYFQSKGHLKYDYIIQPRSNYGQIRIKVEGADKIEILKDGSLVLHTEFGDITEDAPYAEQAGREVKAKWIVRGDSLGFQLGKYDPQLPVRLDPLVRTWGTYYGGNYFDMGSGCSKDAAGNIYLTGASFSTDNLTIATSGSHKSVFSGNWFNPFLVKFDNNGVRLWGTFYGGVADGGGQSCVADKQGNVFMCGYAGPETGTVIATSGSHQPANSGGVYDGFLAKFNSSGVRQWGTYYGGTSEEIADACDVDTTGNVFMSGFTSSTTDISSPGSHQSSLSGSYDAFLVKFSANGVRDWGTYYGGISMEEGYSCATDLAGNVYMAGFTGSQSTSLIATALSHQPNSGGNSDAFLVKFNNNGIRQWGTFYGGAQMDGAMGCSTDAAGNVYFCGYTTSTNSISTSGCHQAIYGGGSNWGDAFISKFNSSGTRLWGTYYGGSGEDWSASCKPGNNGNVYLAGTTDSDSVNVISTAGSQQMTFGGGYADAFVAAFDLNGQRLSGTYYGGSGRDESTSSTVIGANSVFVAGLTDSNTTDTIASGGSHQQTYGGGQYDGFLVKFNMCLQVPAVSVSASSSLICAGQSATLTAAGANTYSWNNGGTGSALSVTPATSTSYTVTGANSEGCTNAASISLAVSPCTSVRSLNPDAELNVFPVPSHDHFITIVRSVNEPVTIRVRNLLGAVVLESVITEREYTLDLSSQAGGLYFLEVAGASTAVKKLVLD